jgi:trk system potassium uptake protein TrkA
MRAIVIGAGDVGYDVARMLSLQRHDVTVIDTDLDRINQIRDSLDVLAIRGSGTSIRTLTEARILDADLLVAVTDVDEVNLVASMLAERVGKETVTIARVRSEEFAGTDAVFSIKDFGLDLIIHPEESTAAEAVALLRRASATDIIEFADGRVQLVGIRMDRDAPVIGRTLQEVAAQSDHLTFRIAGIARGARTIIPRGDERIQKNDQVFVLVEAGQVPQVIHALGKSGARLDHVMILGGTKVAGRIAARLCERRGKRVNVKLIEPDRAEAERLAEVLEGALVIHGEPSDMDLLVIEGVGEMDAFVAVTDDEESNLVSCLMAKHLGVRKTVAMLSKSAYIPISQSIGLDAAVSQKLAISREVLRFLRGKHVTSVATILGLDAEILELEADPSSPITQAPLAKQKLPKGILVAAVVSAGRGGVEIATGTTHVRPGDRVIVFAMPDRVEEVEGYFGVGVASG